MSSVDWIVTASGKRFSLSKCTAADVCLDDIAHSLARQCRFAGHVSTFYTVAEHSVLVSKLLSKLKDDYWGKVGLLHDAAEAYVGDLTTPLKNCMGDVSSFSAVEYRVNTAIAERFGIDLSCIYSPEVRKADLSMLAREAIELFGAVPREWGISDIAIFAELSAAELPICCWSPITAKSAFLARFQVIKNAQFTF